MRRESFTANQQKHLVRTVRDQWAFVPPLLPPAFELDFPTIRQLAEAERALGELRGLTRKPRDVSLLVRPFMRREAVLSSRIEGTMADVEQLVLFEEAPARVDQTDAREVANYFSALFMGMEFVDDGNDISLWLIRQLHQRLMQGVRGQDKNPGQFRSVQNAIGSRGEDVTQATYLPPPPTELDTLLRDIERFINDRGELPLLVKIAAAHYQFEAIHPFNDGNGRVGRLLITLMLARENALPLPLLYASAYFEEHRDDYYDALLAVSQNADWLNWIGLFNTAVTTQAQDAIRRAGRLMDLREEYTGILQGMNVTGNVLLLLDKLFERPTITVTRAAEELDVTRRAAGLMIAKLEKARIVREITGYDRYRVWMAPAIIEAVQEE